MKNIGMKIRAVRKALGMTLQQVALAAGYDAGNLSKPPPRIATNKAFRINPLCILLLTHFFNVFILQIIRKGNTLSASTGGR